MSHDDGTEADYMYDCQLAASGGDEDLPDPEFEVHQGNSVRFVGSRNECWAFKLKHGGYVRPFSGYDDD